MINLQLRFYINQSINNNNLSVSPFLTGPEIFFSPEIFSADHKMPLPEMVDRTIQACPIDTRRPLYRYITVGSASVHVMQFRDWLLTRARKSHDHYAKTHYSCLVVPPCSNTSSTVCSATFASASSSGTT
jgi:hypothetical protein